MVYSEVYRGPAGLVERCISTSTDFGNRQPSAVKDMVYDLGRGLMKGLKRFFGFVPSKTSAEVLDIIPKSNTSSDSYTGSTIDDKLFRKGSQTMPKSNTLSNGRTDERLKIPLDTILNAYVNKDMDVGTYYCVDLRDYANQAIPILYAKNKEITVARLQNDFKINATDFYKLLDKKGIERRCNRLSGEELMMRRFNTFSKYVCNKNAPGNYNRLSVNSLTEELGISKSTMYKDIAWVKNIIIEKYGEEKCQRVLGGENHFAVLNSLKVDMGLYGTNVANVIPIEDAKLPSLFPVDKKSFAIAATS